MKPRVREVIVVEGRYDRNTLLQAVDAAVQGALDRVPGLVGRLLFYVVLFALVMLGLPFVLGFWLGRWRERARRRRETSPGGDR